MEVTGGFIIGLDGDTEFDSHINFIQEAGIPMAMAGLLTALKETDLWQPLETGRSAAWGVQRKSDRHDP